MVQLLSRVRAAGSSTIRWLVLILLAFPSMAISYKLLNWSYDEFKAVFSGTFNCENHGSGHLVPGGGRSPATPGMVALMLHGTDWLQKALAYLGAVPLGIAAAMLSIRRGLGPVVPFRGVAYFLAVHAAVIGGSWALSWLCLAQAKLLFYLAEQGWFESGFARLVANAIGLVFCGFLFAGVMFVGFTIIERLTGPKGSGVPPAVTRGAQVGNIQSVQQTLLYVRRQQKELGDGGSRSD